MNKGQIRRLVKVILVAIVYTAAVLWVESFDMIRDSVVNWFMSILFPGCVFGIIILIVVMVWEIYDKIRDYIIDGN